MTMSAHNRMSLRPWADQVITQTERSLAGLTEVAQLCLVAYCTRGHVLLEGNPGLGKTELVKALAGALGLEWGRIQFTPDLMPADITGTVAPDFENGTLNQWQFNPGPVFTSLLLADEINRATPKTQAALLEAMAESQVTVLGRTYKLPNPFLVLATQNPIDQVGTYALPEAQADRFMFKILMPVPDKDIISQIMKKTHRIFVEDKAGVASSRRPLYIACNQHHTKGLPISDPEQEVIQRYTATRNRFRRHIAEVDQLGMPDNGQDDEDVRFVGLHEHVRQHIINLFLASNVRIQELSGIDTAQRRRAEVIGKLMVYGFGPRAVINLMRATRAWSLLFGSAQLPDAERIGDAEALAHVVIPILRHRIKLSFAWDEQYEDANRTTLRGVPATFAFQDDKLAALIAELCAVTAPSTADAAHYRTLFVTELRKVLGREATR